MAWIGKSQGIFNLHDSDTYCGSYININDACEILGVSNKELMGLPQTPIDTNSYISELVLHKAWGKGLIKSAYPNRIGNATRSFDELIVIKLLQLTYPNCDVEPQVQFGRKYVDIKVINYGVTIYIEFVGPSHFIPQYQRELISPLDRKRQIENYFGNECVIWPFWIQRCEKNIKSLFDSTLSGMASVWSTKAFFGDFLYINSAEIIEKISKRFRAINESGIGYMYGNSHTNKPIHPIINQIKFGTETINRLIPKGNKYPIDFWIPQELQKPI